MITKVNDDMTSSLVELLKSGKSSPYIFRTRLERLIYMLNNNSNYSSSTKIKEKCDLISLKLKCLSDQSNQTPDGTLNSYLFLKNDLDGLLDEIS